jgi:hypothetical protein
MELHLEQVLAPVRRGCSTISRLGRNLAGERVRPFTAPSSVSRPHAAGSTRLKASK